MKAAVARSPPPPSSPPPCGWLHCGAGQPISTFRCCSHPARWRPSRMHAGDACLPPPPGPAQGATGPCGAGQALRGTHAMASWMTRLTKRWLASAMIFTLQTAAWHGGATDAWLSVSPGVRQRACRAGGNQAGLQAGSPPPPPGPPLAPRMRHSMSTPTAAGWGCCRLLAAGSARSAPLAPTDMWHHVRTGSWAGRHRHSQARTHKCSPTASSTMRRSFAARGASAASLTVVAMSSSCNNSDVPGGKGQV